MNLEALNLLKDDTMEKFLDESTWDSQRSSIEQAARDGRIGAAYMVHPGTTMNSTCRSTKEPNGKKTIDHDMKQKTRTDTCLALRFLQLVGICTSF